VAEEGRFPRDVVEPDDASPGAGSPPTATAAKLTENTAKAAVSALRTVIFIAFLLNSGQLEGSQQETIFLVRNGKLFRRCTV
jgi:hypothetical protein